MAAVSHLNTLQAAFPRLLIDKSNSRVTWRLLDHMLQNDQGREWTSNVIIGLGVVTTSVKILSYPKK